MPRWIGLRMHGAGGAEAHERPGGLRSGARAFALEHRIVVAGAGLAPAAVLVLAALEPVAGADDPVLLHVHADGAQAAQDLPGAVDVIDAPAPIPGAILLLGILAETGWRAGRGGNARSKPM